LARSLISALEGSLKQLRPLWRAFAAARRDCGKQQWPPCLAKYTAAASTWSFDQGTLTVHHLGKTVSLGGYATHEFAAKVDVAKFARGLEMRSA